MAEANEITNENRQRTPREKGAGGKARPRKDIARMLDAIGEVLASDGQRAALAFAEKRYGLPERTAWTYCQRVMQKWSDERAATRAHDAALTIQRLEARIEEAKAAKQWSAITSLEKLLANVRGVTREPTVAIQQNVAFVGGNAQGALATLNLKDISDEELELLERLAERVEAPAVAARPAAAVAGLLESADVVDADIVGEDEEGDEA